MNDIYERLSKFTCPKCAVGSDCIVRRTPAFLEALVKGPTEGGQLAVYGGAVRDVNYERSTFFCIRCQHVWPVPKWMHLVEEEKPATPPASVVDQPINSSLMSLQEMCIKAGMPRVEWAGWSAYLGRRHLALFGIPRGKFLRFHGFLPYEEEYWRHGMYAGQPRGPANDPEFKKLVCEVLGLEPNPKCAKCDKTWKEHLPLPQSACKFPASKSPTTNKVINGRLPNVYEATDGVAWRRRCQGRNG